MVEEQLESKCRLCGIHETKSLVMLHIFEPENYVSKIHKVLPISIMEYDPLPKRICYTCHYKVDEFYIFYEQCMKTQDLLKKELSWCQNQKDNGAVISNKPTPLMEVIKSGTKNLNGSSLKVSDQQQKPTKKTSNLLDVSCKKVEKNLTKPRNKNIGADSNSNPSSKSRSDFSSKNKSNISTSSVSSAAASVVSSSLSSTIRDNNSPPSPDSTIITATALKAALSTTSAETCKKPEDINRDKLLLTLKKSTNNTDTWSVPPASSGSNKRKKMSGKDRHHGHSNRPDCAIMDRSENYTNQKGVVDRQINISSNSSLINDKGSNLKEYNGQDIKRGVNNENLTHRSEAPHINQHNCSSGGSSSSSSGSSKLTSNDSKTEIPDYLILTRIPMAGPVYTCLYCEQTFVSQPTACSHKCDRLNKTVHVRSNEDDNNVNDKQESPIYICDICNVSFSRHASLTAHQAVHYSNPSDSESDGDQDENRIFFGQKKKKKSTIVRKIITDQDGNYL